MNFSRKRGLFNKKNSLPKRHRILLKFLVIRRHSQEYWRDKVFKGLKEVIKRKWD